ncbi:hypothetical protein [Mycobacterium avium]|uniref:hypothetical protein n=1 Tax=Mycobacterium avium TaxID=1764 RepID=UPI00115A8BAB|nr:hypothetical protein [Mycobacterium avium]
MTVIAPKFEQRGGQVYVQWRGREWGLLTPILDTWNSYSYGFYPHNRTTVRMSFELLLLDEPDEPKTIPDNIILGDN